MAEGLKPFEEIIGIGAEAVLIKSSWFGHPCLIKRRLPKAYRLPELDKMIRKQRTILEVRALISAKECGVLTPMVFEVDVNAGSIIMDFINGTTLKESIPKLSIVQLQSTFLTVGRAVGKLHQGGIIHGDLTTSNILVTGNNDLIFIDFGLTQRSQSLEDRGVEVHLLKRVLTSTHAPIWKEAYASFLLGYGETGPHSANEIDTRVTAIELRGRYIKKENRHKRLS